MKIIDLLNKIAKGEEVLKKIKYKHCEYEYKEEIRDYEDCDNEYEGERFYERYLTPRIFKDGNTETMLNKELEIIEEDKKIENKKIKIIDILSNDYYMRDELYAMLTSKDISRDINTLKNKINEIIDYINKGDK